MNRSPSSITPLRRRRDSSSPTSETSTARRLVARARAIASLLGLRLRRLRKRDDPGMRLHSWIEDGWEMDLADEEHVVGVGLGHRRRDSREPLDRPYDPPYEVRRPSYERRGSHDRSYERVELGYDRSGGQRASYEAHASWDNYRASIDSYTRSLGRNSSLGHAHSNGHPGGDHRTEDAAAWRRDRVHHAVRHNRAPARWAEMVDWVEVELTERE